MSGGYHADGSRQDLSRHRVDTAFGNLPVRVRAVSRLVSIHARGMLPAAGHDNSCDETLLKPSQEWFLGGVWMKR